MITIHKFPIIIDDGFQIETHRGAKVLTIQLQHGTPTLWAMVDTDAPKAKHLFAIRGTGHDCEGLPADTYVDTFQVAGGSLVFHLFYLGQTSDLDAVKAALETRV